MRKLAATRTSKRNWSISDKRKRVRLRTMRTRCGWLRSWLPNVKHTHVSRKLRVRRAINNWQRSLLSQSVGTPSTHGNTKLLNKQHPW